MHDGHSDNTAYKHDSSSRKRTDQFRIHYMPLSGIISTTIERIACAVGIGYRHNWSLKLSNDLSDAAVTFPFHVA